jgi:hypothetical protein
MAENEIARLVTRYAVLNDDGDFAGLAAMYLPGGRLMRPSGGDPVVGPDAIRASYEARPPRTSRHLVTNIVVELVSDQEATCRSALLLYTAAPGEEPAPAAAPALLGGFRDRLMRTPEGWRFAERIGFVHMKIS